MTELEEAGIWEKLSGKKIPYYNREDMPSYGFGFVYKILKNWFYHYFFVRLAGPSTLLSKISIRTLLLITKLLFFSTYVMELKMLTFYVAPPLFLTHTDIVIFTIEHTIE